MRDGGGTQRLRGVRCRIAIAPQSHCRRKLGTGRVSKTHFASAAQVSFDQTREERRMLFFQIMASVRHHF